MKRVLSAVALAMVVAPVLAADVGVSVTIGQPGFYGRIDIGDVPRPAVVYAQPMVVQPVPVGVIYQPIYLHVPPGHSKNWRKHCSQYNACGRPVYFVKDDWYNDVYVPHHQKRQGAGNGKGKGRGGDHGRGNGNGNGNGRGRG